MSQAIFNPTNDAHTGEITYKVLRRDRSVAEFDVNKISVAINKAFLAVEGNDIGSSRVRDLVEKITNQVVTTLKGRLPEGGIFHLEHIQDRVELCLMRSGEHEVARRYVLYRDARAKERSDRSADHESESMPALPRITRGGALVPLDFELLRQTLNQACSGLADVSARTILEATLANLYDGVEETEVLRSAVLSARALIEKEPQYSLVTSRLLLNQIRIEVLERPASDDQMAALYPEYLASYVKKGISVGRLDKRLGEFDLSVIGNAIKAERDLQFKYLGLQTLYDRYLLHHEGVRFELPQAFWMRIAMGLALNETDREARAIEFYEILSSFDFVSSTPTLFNSGTLRPQLSSCFLTTVTDDLSGIYDSIKENALLSKYSGGLGNDWTPVRALGAHIEGTNGKSQGVVPFLKVVNDTAVAVNQGGKRQGAVCSYLETWHMDIEEFLELRKNTGDDRRRCHDMNTANWIPDLFMERVRADAEWTLFSPDEAPDLHEVYGPEFRDKYEQYERLAIAGLLKLHKKVSATALWRKMLTMLFETGHPWITFKDACNLRSPQQHAGVVHSSNLCTEITLNTSDSETAVCNLGSINLVAHIENGGIDKEKLAKTCRTAMRMLDNVVDINFYSVPKARQANLKHRPVGLGLMGFQDALTTLRISYASEAAVEFADEAQEAISYYAILGSSELAKERGAYSSYQGSLWSKNVLPIDSLEILDAARSNKLEVNRSSKMDWTPVREHIARWGMRNSNCLAIAPTATISNIIGVSQSIEPTFQNLFVKSNLSGEFTVVNEYLVEDLKKLGLWDEVMAHDLKYFEGSVQKIERVPAELKELYATAFEVGPQWLIAAASRRQKWIDQGQSLNLYLAEPNGRKLSEMYMMAWTTGLKTTYYLRTTSATSTEKSTIQTGALNAVPTTKSTPKPQPQACSIEDPTCESCQ